MGLFGAIDAATSGAHVSRVWLDAISDNVANVNTDRPGDEEPFRARMVRVTSIDRGRNPVVDLGVEMTNLLIANRSYQANLRVIEHARDSYKSALQIGSR
jgi:flagellar basal-body rod protein FlgC